jgi:hypothetical protein
MTFPERQRRGLYWVARGGLTRFELRGKLSCTDAEFEIQAAEAG